MDAATSPVNLEWSRLPSGFKVIPGAEAGYLVCRDPDESPVSIRPMDDANVITAFSRLKDEDQVRRFANRYGYLWIDHPGATQWSPSESEIRQINELERTYRIVNEVGLILNLALTMRDIMQIVSDPRRTVDQTTVAAVWLGNALWQVGGYHVGVSCDDTGAIRQTIRPASLLGAIWIQFSSVVADHVAMLQICDHCRRPYVAQAKSRGKARRWCGSACKKANQRSKQGA